MAKTQFTQKKPSLSPKRVLGSLVALLVAFLLLVSVVNVSQKYFALKKHIRELTIEQQSLQAKQATLTKTNAYLATSEGTEQALREKYNVVKPGEGMIVIVSPEATVPPKQPSTVVRWWNAILQALGFEKK